MSAKYLTLEEWTGAADFEPTSIAIIVLMVTAGLYIAGVGRRFPKAFNIIGAGIGAATLFPRTDYNFLFFLAGLIGTIAGIFVVELGDYVVLYSGMFALLDMSVLEALVYFQVVSVLANIFYAVGRFLVAFVIVIVMRHVPVTAPWIKGITTGALCSYLLVSPGYVLYHHFTKAQVMVWPIVLAYFIVATGLSAYHLWMLGVFTEAAQPQEKSMV